MQRYESLELLDICSMLIIVPCINTAKYGKVIIAALTITMEIVDMKIMEMENKGW